MTCLVSGSRGVPAKTWLLHCIARREAGQQLLDFIHRQCRTVIKVDYAEQTQVVSLCASAASESCGTFCSEPAITSVILPSRCWKPFSARSQWSLGKTQIPLELAVARLEAFHVLLQLHFKPPVGQLHMTRPRASQR